MAWRDLFRGRRLKWCVGLALAIALFAEAANILVGRNRRTVVAGRVFRCAQPDAGDLRQAVAQHGIRTVLNLRGFCDGFDWFEEECRTTADTDIAQEDLTLSSGRLPAPCEMQRLLEIFDRAEYPILIHCRRGVDRTGLVSALAKLLLENASVAEARRQLTWRYGHVALGRTTAMLRFFDLYESWLLLRNQNHSPDALREYINCGYTAGPARARAELRGQSVRAQTVGSIELRVFNESQLSWHLKPGTNTGIALKYLILDQGGVEVQSGYAGLFEHVVRPGQHVDLTLVVNKLPAGRYALHADLMEDPVTSFAQLGNQPLGMEFIIP